MAMESKKQVYDLIPHQYIPITLFFKKGTSTQTILLKCVRKGIHFPFIAKPDIGLKGYGVEKIQNQSELSDYINRMPKDFLIQELVDFPVEVGIFYVRFPHQVNGRITGIVLKEFLAITGNGKNSILELIMQNARSYRQLKALRRKYGEVLHQVLPTDEKFILVPFGSHTRGAKFVDISNQMTDDLSNTIDSISRQITGFHFGRLDIRCSSLNELSKARNYSIIEVNGAGSEPTHIYDPRHSLFFGWKEIVRHWNMLYKISVANYAKGYPYLGFRDGRNMLKENERLESELKLVHK